MNQYARAPAIPFGVATLGIATFASMDVVMKILSTEMGPYNAMLWRTLISVSIAAALFAWKEDRWPIRPTVRVHIWRGVVTSLMAFLFFWAGGNWIARRRPFWGWTQQDVGDFLFYGMLGVVVGGRWWCGAVVVGGVNNIILTIIN